jgi:hypothetical protein
MSYFIRLTEVCLAAYFLMNLAVGMMVSGVSAMAVRRAERMRPAAGARLLLLLRLAPTTLSLLTVLAFCVPSYLRFEHDAEESVGLLCSALAVCGLLLLAASIVRMVWGIVLSARFLRQFQGSSGLVFSLVGLLRPQVIVSGPIREALSSVQMDAAMRHEAAHSNSLDNLKRLAIYATPSLLPGSFGKLESGWNRLTEWAADDAAVAGEPRRAIALAEALVCVARLSGQHAFGPIVSSLVAGQEDLSQRVGRLLASQPAQVSDIPGKWIILLPMLAVVTLVVSQQKELLYLVHCVMERMVQ